jgi:hypothetical protein
MSSRMILTSTKKSSKVNALETGADLRKAKMKARRWLMGIQLKKTAISTL